MTRKQLKAGVLKLSEGVLETVTDFVLYAVYYQMVIWERPTMYSVINRAPRETEEFLSKVNYQTIKRAINQLVFRGLIKKQEGSFVLTKTGEERLVNLLPGLGRDEKRRRGEIYLIFYDIADFTKAARERVRRFLKNSGARAIQESVFVSTSNLREKLLALMGETEVSGKILITKLGKDSLLGEETITNFLAKIYKLDELAERYEDFLQEFSAKNKKENSPLTLSFAFNSIYRDDPKLPADFLPKNWSGYRASSLYRQRMDRSVLLQQQ